MAYFIIKLVITAILIVTISEIAKKFSAFGAILASLPLTSILAIIWLYVDTKDVNKITDLTSGILWMIIPSLSFFIILPLLLKTKLGFGMSLFLSCTATSLFYFLFVFVIRKFGIMI